MSTFVTPMNPRLIYGERRKWKRNSFRVIGNEAGGQRKLRVLVWVW